MAPLPKGNSPVRGNVCKADKRVAVSARKLSSVCETEGFKKESYIFGGGCMLHCNDIDDFIFQDEIPFISER